MSLLTELAAFDSATVQNAAILVRGYVHADEDYTGPDLQQYVAIGGPVTVGYAVTSTWTPISDPAASGVPTNYSDYAAYWDALAAVGAPTIAVLQDVDAPARRGAMIGDCMATTMKAMGSVGAVVDGCARDIPGVTEAGISLWATGRVPGHGPFTLRSINEPVTVARLTIRPGDILIGDADGITRLSPEIAADVLKACHEVRAKEDKVKQIFLTPGFTIESWQKSR
ncbi:MAG: RraA family protein [Opitutaceae bacterium]